VIVKEEEPEDLSLRTREVGTQTDRAIDSVLEGFSPHQVKMVLELLTRLAATPTTATTAAPTTTHNETNFNNTNDFTNAFNANNTNAGAGPKVDCNDHSIEEPSNGGHPRYGWISLEPENPSLSFTRTSPPLVQKKSFPSTSHPRQGLSRSIDQPPSLAALPQPPPLMRARDASQLPPLQRLSNRRATTERFYPSRPETSMWHIPARDSSSLARDDVESARATIKYEEPFLHKERWSPSSNSISETESEDRRGRLCRDQRIAQSMDIPFSVSEIIQTPMEEFNDLLSRHQLSEEQINLCRDIRRRGKNKIAAQNCRKRKLEQICLLETDLSDARTRKEELVKERVELLRLRREWQEKLERLEEGILGDLGRQGSVLKVNPENLVVVETAS